MCDRRKLLAPGIEPIGGAFQESGNLVGGQLPHLFRGSVAAFKARSQSAQELIGN